MAKKRTRVDPSQLSLQFDQQIREYTDLKEEILTTHQELPQGHQSYEEACIEIAAAVKRVLRSTGMSREQMVDAVNGYFGWAEKVQSSKFKVQSSKDPLSIHMFNHYLSKPVEYPLPAFLIFAIQRIAESLELARVFAEAEDGKVISKGEVRQWALGKLDEHIMEMQRLKKELRLRRS